MAGIRRALYLSGFAIAFVLLIAALWREEYYLPLSIIMILAVMIPFWVRFERKSFHAESMVMIAMMAAIAAVGRVPFVSLPSVQPTSFVIIVSALVLGPEVGFIVGSVAAVVSNLFLGQGPWTPWQMFCWGMMGFSAGLLRHQLWMGTRFGRVAFGFVWGFLFGWIMNIWYIIGYFGEMTWHTFAMAYAASFYFDLAHALSNVFFLGLFAARWIKILTRMKVKYGVLQEDS
ncbi:ECF transporter S component [Paenibacillus pinihumi]|uniref:ECF transporter S component n=1 Tax=Paenibacillus pinihumi TaxID=669462 RepID=UPI000404C0F7|nr:ECF transporter S component [Paenibacillus pinihumi]